MPSRKVDLDTIEEWRELGFFYTVDTSEMKWSLRGDRRGLLSFSTKLREYANDPKNKTIGEHEHFGPYFYLKVITGNSTAITDSGWTGTTDDFRRLAELIEDFLSRPAQKEFVIAQDFAPTTIFVIQFKIEEDGFDPSSVDPMIQHRS
jgi:hypothetical protein